MTSLSGTGKAPLVAPPHVKRRYKETEAYLDDDIRASFDHRLRPDPEHIWAARMCLRDREFDIVRKYFLGTGLVTIHHLDVDDGTKELLLPVK